MWMANSRSPYGARRLALACFALLLVALLLFPGQIQGLFDYLDGPVGYVVRLPLEAVASHRFWHLRSWQQYVSAARVAEENQQLKQEIEWLRGQNTNCAKRPLPQNDSQPCCSLRSKPCQPWWPLRSSGATRATAIDRSFSTKGKATGFRPDMGVITPAGVVGRVVKTTGATVGRALGD